MKTTRYKIPQSTTVLSCARVCERMDELIDLLDRQNETHEPVKYNQDDFEQLCTEIRIISHWLDQKLGEV